MLKDIDSTIVVGINKNNAGETLLALHDLNGDKLEK